jgi:deoxyribose-phosphate aldolase
MTLEVNLGRFDRFPSELASYIDHTLLNPQATQTDIDKLLSEAKEFKFRNVCVERQWVKRAKTQLKDSGVGVVTVVGFPSGLESISEKVTQTKEAIAFGADEIDFVLNRSFLHNRQYSDSLEEMTSVVQAADKKPVKVILETSELSLAEKAIACAIAKLAGVKFVKTSTGFSKAGATVEDVSLMREAVGSEIGIKASGGVRTSAQAIEMIRAGATRLGTSSSVGIVTDKSPGKGKGSAADTY